MTTKQALRQFGISLARWGAIALVTLCMLVALSFGVSVMAIVTVVGVIAGTLLVLAAVDLTRKA